MSDLAMAARALVNALNVGHSVGASEELAREFVEKVTFASADEIMSMLQEILAEDWMGLPPWARNLAYRLACLQRPDDADLLKKAAADLLSFGPDWDAQAAALGEAAARLEEPCR